MPPHSSACLGFLVSRQPSQTPSRSPCWKRWEARVRCLHLPGCGGARLREDRPAPGHMVGKWSCPAVGPGRLWDVHHFQEAGGSSGGTLFPSWPSCLTPSVQEPHLVPPLLAFCSHHGRSSSAPHLLQAGCSLAGAPPLTLSPGMCQRSLKLLPLTKPALFSRLDAFAPFLLLSGGLLPPASPDKQVLIASFRASLL